MKILVLLGPAPGASPDKMGPHLAAETQHAYDLYKSGVAREIYFRQDTPGAVMVFECKDAAEAAEIANSLPLAKAGFLKIDIIPLAPFAVWDKLSPGPGPAQSKSQS